MPKRRDLDTILIIGSGPIIIGQACEFDYSGSQACKALREEGYRVVLINSNPATIMTDPEMADRTYIEPLTREVAKAIIARERPDALLPTLGGQTGLNLASDLAEEGTLEKYGVELIGASFDAIHRTEDRLLFREIMEEIEVGVLASAHVGSVEDALAFAGEVGYPVIIRPSFTLGGAGGGIARSRKQLSEMADSGLSESPVNKILIEESVIGWKEYELEVMRDRADNVVIICSMENLDPMGIHTGDSITVAPIQTLTDREYQDMRDEALRIIRRVGVETGGSNIQFAVDPETGRRVVVEMNPRVSRSSALASKATGFAIARIAAKLAVGYTLDELPNEITGSTPACFEPAIDYCVTKIPRWDFSKFKNTDSELTTQMKSVGEVMAIGRTFIESFQKALRSLEQDRDGWGADGQDLVPFEKLVTADPILREKIMHRLKRPAADRIFAIRDALLAGIDLEEIYEQTSIDRWFLHQFQRLAELETEIRSLPEITPDLLRAAKRAGFSNRQLAEMQKKTENEIRTLLSEQKSRPGFRLVDTCAGEFEAQTPYFYSSYDTEDEMQPDSRRGIMILGGGPNRIGQGIEFDYCCVQAAFTLREEGEEVIMVNCNPETVSTDYDTSDRLYFEPLTLEHVLAICRRENPRGVILQFGGQTPLKLALALKHEGIPILGTTPENIDLCEDREKFSRLVQNLNLKQPPHGMGRTEKEARVIADRIGYPVLVRPSYVLGGRAMAIIYDECELATYLDQAVRLSPEHPVLIDSFLSGAVEVDVDAVSDGTSCVIGGIMEHIEQAGIHSGDSACSLPPQHLPEKILKEIRRQTRLLAAELEVVGLLNIQFAVRNEEIYLLEVNPRASRTVPFVSKTTGVPLARLAATVMLGKNLGQLGISREVSPRHVAVKEAVLPFNKFPGADVILGPEMHSTGEVMGIDQSFGLAFAKAQSAAGNPLPSEGSILFTVADEDKSAACEIASEFRKLGFSLLATSGTARFFADRGIGVQEVKKIGEGVPDITDLIREGLVQLIINSPRGRGSRVDARRMRREALKRKVPLVTTMQGADAALRATIEKRNKKHQLLSLQEYHNSQ